MNTYKEIIWPGWEVVRRIGNGSFGTVHEIQRDIYGDIEKAALKVITIPHNEDEVDYLRSSGFNDASITQTFHQQVGEIAKEYKLMAQLRGNPNIVHCDDFRDIQHDDGLGWDIYIKMELLTPLMKRLDCVITEKQIIQLGMDICNALIDCQKKHIIHRDIKPQNVFVSESGHFKLGDFGIARTIEQTTHATAGIGTYSYMAPEVERNEPYGKTADIYSLGLMMYWLLNERRGPFMPLPPNIPKYADEERARRKRFAGEPLPPPKNGSEKIKDIVLRACSFRPEDRFDSASEMFAALNSLISNSEQSQQSGIAAAGIMDAVDQDATVRSGWEEKQRTDTATVRLFSGKAAAGAGVFGNTKKDFSPMQSPGEDPGKPVAAQQIHKLIGKALTDGRWQCVCGRVNAAYVSSCVCRVNKRDLQLIPEIQHKTANRKAVEMMLEQTSQKPASDGMWQCSCGRSNAAYVSTCVCGVNKRNAKCGSGSIRHSAERPIVKPDILQEKSSKEMRKERVVEDWRKSEEAHRAWLKSLEKSH